jgi:hypothetical protein
MKKSIFAVLCLMVLFVGVTFSQTFESHESAAISCNWYDRSYPTYGVYARNLAQAWITVDTEDLSGGYVTLEVSASVYCKINGVTVDVNTYTATMNVKKGLIRTLTWDSYWVVAINVTFPSIPGADFYAYTHTRATYEGEMLWYRWDMDSVHVPW